MKLRERMYLLTSPAEVDEFLEQFPTNAIFKAGGCHKTNMGFTQIEKALDPRESIHLGFVRAVENSEVADYVSARAGVAQQSPQIILFVDGKRVFDSDHWHISQPTLTFALNRHLGSLPGEPDFPKITQEEEVYRTVLQALVKDQLTDDAFRQQWSALPRKDNHLDELLREMDEALCCGERCVTGGCSALPMAQRKRATLKAKASQLLSLLF